MERPNFRFTDWYAVNNAVRDAVGNGLKYLPLSWNVLGLDVFETRRWDNLTSYEWEAAMAIGFAKRKTSSHPCHPSPPSGTTKTQKSLLSRDQIAGEGGHAAGGAQSAMALP